MQDIRNNPTQRKAKNSRDINAIIRKKDQQKCTNYNRITKK